MRKTSVLTISCAVLLSCSVALAQHGRGGGAPSGSMGNSGGMGNSGSMGPGMSGSHDGSMGSDRGMGRTSNSSTPQVTGKESPDQILSRNTKLSDNLQKLLPAGMTTQQACSGFKNLGSCVSAIHVAHNLGISFTDLKSAIAGGDSLGKAIQTLDPKANAKAEAKKGQKQAKADIQAANS